MNPLIERLEPFCHGLGKAILREVAEDHADLQAENSRLNDDVSMHMRVAVRAVH
jgi:hypothetical protein